MTFRPGLESRRVRRQRLLLARLISADGHALSSGRLVDGLWGEEPPGSARKILQVYVHGLRTQIGEAVRTKGPAYSLDTSGDVDAIRFEKLRQEAKDLLDVEPRRASELLSEALVLWNGPAYADLEDEPALAPEIARLEELRVAVLGDRIDADPAMGAHLELIGELQGLTHDPSIPTSWSRWPGAGCSATSARTSASVC